MRLRFIFGGLLALLIPGLWSISTAHSFETPYAVAYCKLSGCTITGEMSLNEGFEATGDYDGACTQSSRRFDFDGLQACGPFTDTAASSVNISAPPAAPLASGGNQTGVNLVLRPGSGTHKAVMASASWVNNTTTFTVTIDGTANTGTEGTAFECNGSDQACADNVANWADALAGVHACSLTSTTTCATFGFTPIAATTYFWPAPEDSPGKFIDSIACSTGAAATLTNGTNGRVLIPGTSPALTFRDTTSSSPQVCSRASSVIDIAKADSCATTNLTTLEAARIDAYSSGGVIKVSTNPAAATSATIYSSDSQVIFNSGNDLASGTRDTGIARASAGCVQINTSAGASPAGKGQGLSLCVVSQALTFAANPGDASKTTSGLVPDGAMLMGVTTRVSTTATNCTSVQIGDGTDTDMFSSATSGITAGTTTSNADATAQFGRSPATSAMEVTVTANGGNCFSGVWNVTANYLLPTAATSN